MKAEAPKNNFNPPPPVAQQVNNNNSFSPPPPPPPLASLFKSSVAPQANNDNSFPPPPPPPFPIVPQLNNNPPLPPPPPFPIGFVPASLNGKNNTITPPPPPPNLQGLIFGQSEVAPIASSSSGISLVDKKLDDRTYYNEEINSKIFNMNTIQSGDYKKILEYLNNQEEFKDGKQTAIKMNIVKLIFQYRLYETLIKKEGSLILKQQEILKYLKEWYQNNEAEINTISEFKKKYSDPSIVDEGGINVELYK